MKHMCFEWVNKDIKCVLWESEVCLRKWHWINHSPQQLKTMILVWPLRRRCYCKINNILNPIKWFILSLCKFLPLLLLLARDSYLTHRFLGFLAACCGLDYSIWNFLNLHFLRTLGDDWALDFCSDYRIFCWRLHFSLFFSLSWDFEIHCESFLFDYFFTHEILTILFRWRREVNEV